VVPQPGGCLLVTTSYAQAGLYQVSVCAVRRRGCPTGGEGGGPVTRVEDSVCGARRRQGRRVGEGGYASATRVEEEEQGGWGYPPVSRGATTEEQSGGWGAPATRGGTREGEEEEEEVLGSPFSLLVVGGRADASKCSLVGGYFGPCVAGEERSWFVAVRDTGDDIHAYIHTCKCMYTYMHTHTCMHTCMHAYAHAYTYTCMHTYTHVYMHTHIHACIHTHACIHACIRTSVHTYLHT